jgi:transposase-like protein
MTWFEIVKAIKCPMCGEKTLELEKYKPSVTGRAKPQGTYKCTNCGYKMRL